MSLSRQQFEALAIEQLDAIDRFAHSVSANTAEASDLVQETYLRALKSWQSFELRSFGIKPWLLRILHNIHVARGLRERKQPRPTENEHLDTIPTPDLDAPGLEWEANEDLAAALLQLPAELRGVLNLWAVDELSYREIAEVLEIPIGTVMSRLHRARQQLRTLLQGVTDISSRARNS